MKNMNIIIILVFFVLIILTLGATFIGGNAKDGPSENLGLEDSSQAAYRYTETFTHPKLQFSFKYPESFIVTTMTNGDGSEVIILRDDKNNAVQMLISDFGEDVDITAETLRNNIPDMVIKDAQEVSIGDKRKGLAFGSDNAAFDGDSREVWFVFGGKLYQISAYMKHDDLLKGVFETWQFDDFR